MLSPAESRALHDAFDEALRGRAAAAQALLDLGEVSVFRVLLEADARHLTTLTALFERYDLPLPVDGWAGRAPRCSTVEEACRAAVTSLEARADLCERLLDVTRRADLLTAFRTFQSTALDRHLPALRRAVGAAAQKHRCG
jgi:hypothetical protein